MQRSKAKMNKEEKCRSDVFTQYNHCFLNNVYVGRRRHGRTFASWAKDSRFESHSIEIVLNAYGVIALYSCGPASRLIELVLLSCRTTYFTILSSTVVLATDLSGQRFATVVFATDSLDNALPQMSLPRTHRGNIDVVVT